MGVISVDNADRLYWLGRYTERVYTTLRLYSKSFDIMIDEITDTYQAFCEMIDIPDIYGSKDKFRRNYPFDEANPDSIISNLLRAYDNAVELREEIGSEALSYVQLAIYSMNKAKISKAPLIEMQRAMDNILAFWGIADDSIDSREVRNMIKTGKRIERLDLYARLNMDRKDLVREVNRLAYRITVSGLSYKKENIKMLKELVEAPQIDYYKIVEMAETVL